MSAQKYPKQLMLKMKISEDPDNGDLKVGTLLSPRFEIDTEDLFQSEPKVHFLLDKRLQLKHWDENPKLELINSHVWTFTESLNIEPEEEITGTAEFILKFKISFEEKENFGYVNIIYTGDITLKISSNLDDNSKQSSELEVVSSEGGAVALDMNNLLNYKKVSIRAGEGGVVDVHSDSNTCLNISESESKSKNSHIKVYILDHLVSDKNAVEEWHPTEILVLKATFGNEVRFYHFFAKITPCYLGRTSKITNKTTPPTDIVYNFLKKESQKDSASVFLSCFISRTDHCNFTVEDKNFVICDLKSSMGTNVSGIDVKKIRTNSDDKFHGKWALAWDSAHRDCNIQFGFVSEMNVKIFNAVFPNGKNEISTDIRNTLTEHSFFDESEDLWDLGDQICVDAIQFKRKPELCASENFQKDSIIFKNIILKNKELREMFLANEQRWKFEDDWKFDPYALVHEYYIILRSILIGSGSQCLISFEKKLGVRDRSVAICYVKEAFVLLNINRNSVVRYKQPNKDEDFLREGDPPVQLVIGTHFNIGQIGFEVVEEESL